MNEPDVYLEKLLELKEDRCRRLQALIALKEARLAQLRGFSGVGPQVDEVAPEASVPTPPALRRDSSSLVVLGETARNSAPLGKLQPGGRREYLPITLVSSSSAPPRRQCRSALQRSGLPHDVVSLWHSGQLSADLAMREIMDAVCRCSPSSAAPEERELHTMTQLYTANGAASLGGALGGIVGGLPAERPEVGVNGEKSVGKADDLCPLRHVLGLPVERVTNEVS